MLAAAVTGISQSEAEEVTQPPVLIELFTSQGCASCPPADRLLTELGKDGSAGAEVIPLSFHVDYWNHVGWTDPFSSSAWSQRQRRYAARLAGGRSYTPQLVVVGRSDCVGSDRHEVARQIAAAAAREPAGTLSLELAGDTATVEAGLESQASASDLLLAIFETDLETPVGKGENASRVLHNDYVVRRLVRLAEVAPGAQARVEHNLDLDPDWRRDNLGVAVFLQSRDTLEVHAADGDRL